MKKKNRKPKSKSCIISLSSKDIAEAEADSKFALGMIHDFKEKGLLEIFCAVAPKAMEELARKAIEPMFARIYNPDGSFKKEFIEMVEKTGTKKTQ